MLHLSHKRMKDKRFNPIYIPYFQGDHPSEKENNP